MYDLEKLTLISTIRYPDAFDSGFVIWDGGDNAVVGEDVQIPRGFDEPDTIGANVFHYWVWNVKQNDLWAVNCNTSGTESVAQHGNYFCLQSMGEGFQVLDLTTRQPVIKGIFLGYHTVVVHGPSRGALFDQPYGECKKTFVQFSEDWRFVLFEKDIDFEVDSIHQLGVTESHLFLTGFYSSLVHIIDRRTFDTVCVLKDVSGFTIHSNDVISMHENTARGFRREIYDLKRNKIIAQLDNTDLLHIESNLFLADYMVEDDDGLRLQSYSVISLPDIMKFHEIKKSNSSWLHHPYGTLLKKFDWFSERSYTLEQMLANQSQLILIYKSDNASTLAVFVFDFCDVVMK